MSYRILSYNDVQKLQDPEWLIDNIIPTGPGGSLGVLFGKPGTAKSFVATDIAHHIATGLNWHGRPVQRGRSLYFAAEGGLGFKYRTRAWAKAYGYQATIPRAHYIFDTLDLMDLRQVDRLIDAIHTLDDVPRLVVIDTLARCMGGDENETADMGKAILGAQRLQTLNCCVLLIHHLGHSEERQDTPRGSSALVGAADFMIKCEKRGKTVSLSCAKQKDGDEFSRIELELVSVGGSVVLAEPMPAERASLRRLK